MQRDEFIDRLSKLLHEAGAKLTASDQYDGVENYCGTNWEFETRGDFGWSVSISEHLAKTVNPMHQGVAAPPEATAISKLKAWIELEQSQAIENVNMSRGGTEAYFHYNTGRASALAKILEHLS